MFENLSDKLMSTLKKVRGHAKITESNMDEAMKEIRLSRVAVDDGGLGEGIISVAVAVRDYAGKVVGAITMLGPSFRMLTERINDEIIPSMLQEADLLSKRFGYAAA